MQPQPGTLVAARVAGGRHDGLPTTVHYLVSIYVAGATQATHLPPHSNHSFSQQAFFEVVSLRRQAWRDMTCKNHNYLPADSFRGHAKSRARFGKYSIDPNGGRFYDFRLYLRAIR